MRVFPFLTSVNKVKGPPQGQWTYADWERIPDDGNIYEVIDGMLFVSKVPGITHQTTLLNFYDCLGYPARQQKFAEVYFKRIGVQIPACDPVQPDLVVVLTWRASLVEESGFFVIPDLLAEILSPGSRDYVEGIKLEAYEKAGVPEYVVIDPEERQLRLYTLKSPGDYGEPRVYNEGDSVTFACLPTIVVEVSKLFEGAPDTTV
jgi:Uma2 family endonuclease